MGQEYSNEEDHSAEYGANEQNLDETVEGSDMVSPPDHVQKRKSTKRNKRKNRNTNRNSNPTTNVNDNGKITNISHTSNILNKSKNASISSQSSKINESKSNETRTGREKEFTSQISKSEMNEKLQSTLTALQESVYAQGVFNSIQGARAAKLLNLAHKKRVKKEGKNFGSVSGDDEESDEASNNMINSDSNSLSNELSDFESEGEFGDGDEIVDMNVVATERIWIEAIAEEPRSAHLRTQLANYYFQQSRLKEASYSYEQAIQLDPQNIIAHYDYAFMKHHQFYFALAQFELSIFDCCFLLHNFHNT